MSLRARLALVLAGVMVGPLLAAGAAIGIIVPRSAAATGVADAGRSATAVAVALTERCRAVGEHAELLAQRLSTDASRGALTDAAIRSAVAAARQAQPGFALAVTRPGLPPTAVGPRAAWLAGSEPASCAAGTAPGGGPPALVERLAVSSTGRTLALVLVAAELDGAALASLGGTLRIGADLVLLSTPAGTGRPAVLAGRVPQTRLGPVLDAVAGGERSGRADRRPFAVRELPPFAVLVIGPPSGPAVPAALLGGLLTAAVMAALLVRVLVGRLTAPLDADLREGRDAVTDTFARFGDALGHTHDLNALLETVVAAAMQGADAVIGVAVLAGDDAVQERVRSIDPTAGDGAQQAADRLRALAAAAVSRRAPVRAEDLPAGERTGLGPALALPLLRDTDRVVGAIGVARAPGAAPFDPAALAAVSALARHTGTAVHNVRDHEKFRRQSVTDPLTGAGNYRLLSTTLSREVERASRFDRPLSVMMLDLDHFKQVNDNHGHAFGDAVLREFAQRLQACLREVDTVARYGGEEFAVLLPETDTDGGSAVAERILAAVRAEPFRVGPAERAVTVSIGVASYPVHGRTASEVMRCADSALYEAKRAGRDRWCLAVRTPDAPSVSPAR